MGKETVDVFVLDVRVPKQDPRRVQVQGDISLGSDSSCDIQIRDFGLAPLQGRFHLQNDVLTLTNLGPDHSLKIGSTKCGHGRMYILDKGDKCIIDKVKLIVRLEKIEVQSERLKKEINEEIYKEELNEEEQTKTLAQENTKPGEDFDESTLKEVVNESGESEYEIIEEVVYVDEDGNEVEKPKKPSFFSSFSNMLKKKEDAKKKVVKPTGLGKGKSIKPRKIRQPVTGPLGRIIGFSYNLLFFYILLTLIVPFLEEEYKFKVSTYSQKAFDIGKPYLDKIPPKLPVQVQDIPQLVEAYEKVRGVLHNPESYRILGLFIVYELIFNLLSGISLGYYLVGLKNGGHGLVKRLLAPLRVVLSILLLPLFFIFDLPTLFKKRSFKEFFTGSRYEVRSGGLTFLLSVIVLPLLMVLGFNFPIFLALIGNEKVLQSQVIQAPASKPGKLDKTIALKSTYLGLQGKIHLRPSVVFIPSLSFSQSKFIPSLKVYDYKKEKMVEIDRKPNALEIDALVEYLKNDYLLPFTHPTLAEGLFDPKKRAALDEETVNKVLFTMASINPKNPLNPLLEYGPFLSPYFRAREKLLQTMSPIRVDEVNFINSGNTSYLEFFNQDKVSYRGILRVNGPQIELTSVKYDNSHTQHAQGVIAKFFNHNRPFSGKFSNIFKSNHKSDDHHILSLLTLDIFQKMALKEKISPEEATVLTRLFIEVSKVSLRTDSTEFQNRLLENFEELDKVLLRLGKRNDDGRVKELRLGLNRVQKALYKRDEKFFQLNK